MLLCSEEALAQPFLYLSLHFKTNRTEYYELLQSVRMEGDREAWVEFFLQGLEAMARQGTETARKILALIQEDRKLILERYSSAGSLLHVHDLLQRRPLLSIPAAAKALDLSQPTVAACFGRLGDLGIVREITGMSRNRRFSYGSYFELLAEGTEPIGVGAG